MAKTTTHLSKKIGKTKSKLPFNVFVLIFEGFHCKPKTFKSIFHLFILKTKQYQNVSISEVIDKLLRNKIKRALNEYHFYK